MNTNLSPALRGAGLVVTGAVLWGTVGVATKLLFGIAEVAPLKVGFYRLAIAASLLSVVARLLPQVAWASIDRRSALFFLSLGVTQAGYQGLYFVAVARLGVTPATLIALCSAPVLITVFAAILLAERVRVLSWAAGPISALGTVFLVGGPSLDKGPSGDFWGYAAAFGAALSYASFALASRRLARHYHPFQLVALDSELEPSFSFPSLSSRAFLWVWDRLHGGS